MENKFWEEQMAHEPTRLYYEALKKILRSIIEPAYCTGKVFEVLEIGLDVGISARCFLEFEDVDLTSVDPGEVDIGLREIGELKVGDSFIYHKQKSDDYFAECKREFDIIYIDGDHSYAQTKRDADNAWKHLKPEGVLIGHDILHKNNFYHDKDYGVAQAFREFLVEQNVEATIYPPNPGLIVIKKI